MSKEESLEEFEAIYNRLPPEYQRAVDVFVEVLYRKQISEEEDSKMKELRFPIKGRPVFKSNGIRVLFASGSSIQISMISANILKERFGAELICPHVKINPYWQLGECTGDIYRLSFPIDGVDYVLEGLYFFNIEPSKEIGVTLGDSAMDNHRVVCEMIVGCKLFDTWGKDLNDWHFDMPEDMNEAVSRANSDLQKIINERKG